MGNNQKKQNSQGIHLKQEAFKDIELWKRYTKIHHKINRHFSWINAGKLLVHMKENIIAQSG